MVRLKYNRKLGTIKTRTAQHSELNVATSLTLLHQFQSKKTLKPPNVSTNRIRESLLMFL